MKMLAGSIPTPPQYLQDRLNTVAPSGRGELPGSWRFASLERPADVFAVNSATARAYSAPFSGAASQCRNAEDPLSLG
jgi:hypothetical protein